jgi:serine/threonine protein kinase
VETKLEVTTMNACPKCQNEMPADAPEGLCPACLLGEALDTEPTAIRYVGDYKLTEEIARGGMGVVWKATQTSLNRTVAVKMIRAGLWASADDVVRFRTEAEAAANLQHPNIVSIHEVGEYDGQQYFSMDYIDGQDLGSRLKNGAMPVSEAVDLLVTLTDAVHFAHQRGTLHRDLKPQNILIDRDGRPHVTDFGLAKYIGETDGLTKSGDVLGSPSYMAPEQAEGRLDRIGPQSDVYALGAVLYTMLTGRAPFVSQTLPQTLLKVVQELPTSPRSLQPGLPADLENICMKCLEKAPERRYASARELGDDLRRFQDHEPVLASPPSRWRQAEHWVRSHPGTIAALAALLISGCLFVIYGLWSQTRYLTWLQEHPNWVAELGARTKAAQSIAQGAVFFFPWIIWTWVLFIQAKRGQKGWRSLFDAKSQLAPMNHAVSRRMRLATLLAGGAGLAWAVAVIVKLTDAFVWEGYLPAKEVIMSLYPLVYFSIVLLLALLREHLWSSRGCPAIDLEDQSTVQAQIRAGNIVAAIRCVREVLPDIDLFQAKLMVERIRVEMLDSDPDLVATLSGSKALNHRHLAAAFAAAAVVAISCLLQGGPLLGWLLEMGLGLTWGIVFFWSLLRFHKPKQRMLISSASVFFYIIGIVVLGECLPNYEVSHAGAFLGGVLGAFMVIWPQSCKTQKAS